MELELQDQHVQQQQHKHLHEQHQQPQQDTITEVLKQLQRQQSQIDKRIQHQLHHTAVNTGDTQHTTILTGTTTHAERKFRQDVTNVMLTHGVKCDLAARWPDGLIPSKQPAF